MKRCPSCGETKSYVDFPRNKRSRDGFAVYCKPCHNQKGRESRDRAGGSRGYHLWRRYRVTLAEVDDLLREQGGRCAICGRRSPEHVDHCHVTGRVRGMLCFNCNGGLGQFRDDPEILHAAIEYLRRTGAAELVASLGGV